MKEIGYSIKDLENLSGIKAHTIRIWEKRYELLHPHRTDTNIRYYTDDDLKHILNVSLLVKNGYKISKVAQWQEKDIKDTVLKVATTKSSESGYIERLLICMVNFDNDAFHRILNELLEEYGFEDAVFKVLFDLLQRIGTYWQVGSIFPAQEHYVTHVLRQKLISEIDKIGLNNTRGKTILFYLKENEMHELSLLFYSYLASKMGYGIIYLGQFVPYEDLRKMQDHISIDFVFTAFINAMSKTELQEYLVNVKESFPQQKLFITGWQVNVLQPELPRNVKIIKDYKEFKKYLG